MSHRRAPPPLPVWCYTHSAIRMYKVHLPQDFAQRYTNQRGRPVPREWVMNETNPYNPLRPVTNPAFFFGRDDVFAFFRQHLVGAPLRHGIVLIGRRGLGKSSVLYQLEHQIEERFRLCLIHLNAAELTHEEALIEALVGAIHTTLEDTGASTYRLPDWPTPDENGQPPNLREWFTNDYLGVTLAALRARHLLLAFDDAHLLLDAMDRGILPDDLPVYLGELLATHERLALVFALDARYEDRVLSTELFSDPALHFRLTELPREDAERLVREPVEGIVAYEEGVIDRILALADGHPFLLHSVCRLMVRRSEERHHGGPLTAHDLNAIHDAVIDQAGEILAPLWLELSANERFALAALVQLDRDAPGEAFGFDSILGKLTKTGFAMNKTQLAAALRGLGYNGLVLAHADSYTLPARLIADWVRDNAALPQGAQAPRPRPEIRRLAPVAGILVVLVIVVVLGVAALGGFFGGDDGDNQPAEGNPPTVTLALDLAGTRQAEFATQTEQAKPTNTPTQTHTPTATATPSATPTPTITPSETPTVQPTNTNTPRPMRTPRPTRTPIHIEPTITPPPPTNTPRPSAVPTLDPGA